MVRRRIMCRAIAPFGLNELELQYLTQVDAEIWQILKPKEAQE
ncbi:MAG: hypothetical protein V7K26_01295 [Nostoc sp.]